MRSDQLAIGATVESVPQAILPANCETLGRLYVGDCEYALVRAPRDRALFLVAYGIAWRMDIAGLLASFSEQLREWDRQRELMLGIRDGRVGRKLRAVKKASAR